MAFSRNDAGVTPLHAAAAGQDGGLIAERLAKGDDVNARTRDGLTPLHRAITIDPADMVAALLAKGV